MMDQKGRNRLHALDLKGGGTVTKTYSVGISQQNSQNEGPRPQDESFIPICVGCIITL